MNTRKTIYDKLFTEKVELAKHEVELSLFEDYYKSVSALMDSVSFASKRKDTAKESIKSAIDQLGVAQKVFERAKAYSDDIDKRIKELGLAPDRKYGDMKKGMFEEQQSIKKGIESLTKLQSELRALKF
jgi:DNA repair ATPase RecN